MCHKTYVVLCWFINKKIVRVLTGCVTRLQRYWTGLKLKASCQTFSTLCSKRSKYLKKNTYKKIKKASLFNQLWGKKVLLFSIFSYIHSLWPKKPLLVILLGNCRATGICEQLLIWYFMGCLNTLGLVIDFLHTNGYYFRNQLKYKIRKQYTVFHWDFLNQLNYFLKYSTPFNSYCQMIFEVESCIQFFLHNYRTYPCLGSVFFSINIMAAGG